MRPALTREYNVLIIVRRVLDNRGKPMSPGAANAQVEMFRAKFLYFSDMLAQSRERYQEFVKGVSQKDYAGEAIQAIDPTGQRWQRREYLAMPAHWA